MKLHPLSVPYRTGSAVARFAWILVIGTLSTSQLDGLGALAAGALVAALLAVLAYQVAYVRRFDYDLTDDTFDLASGVVSRRTREIPYRRVQNVDVSRNVIQRALGIAEVRIETAGGGETEAELRYVSHEEADRLQREIGRRKRGAPDTTGEDGTATPAADADEGERLFAVTTRELLLLGIVRVDLRLLSFVTVLLPVVLPSVSRSFPLLDLFRAAPLVLAGLVAVAVVVSSAAAVTAYYGFELRRTEGELRYRRGLLQEYSGTIPLDKVQSVSLTENVIARRLGYAAVEVETAGYAPGTGDGSGSQSAVPLARREDAVALAREVEPFGDVAFERPPKRARTRYAVRYALVVGVLTAVSLAVVRFTGVTPPVPAFSPLALLVGVPLAAHLKWANLGYALGEDHFLAREGFWTRRTRVVPYYRVQTLVGSATVFQRRRHLATLVVDTAGSQGLGATDARALDIDADRAERLRTEVESRFRTSLADARATRRGRRAGRGAPADD